MKQELQNRRQFFKGLAKTILPILGATSKFSFGEIRYAPPSSCSLCMGTCIGSCDSTCAGNCQNSCQGTCSGNCYYSCMGTCSNTCSLSCVGMNY